VDDRKKDKTRWLLPLSKSAEREVDAMECCCGDSDRDEVRWGEPTTSHPKFSRRSTAPPVSHIITRENIGGGRDSEEDLKAVEKWRLRTQGWGQPAQALADQHVEFPVSWDHDERSRRPQNALGLIDEEADRGLQLRTNKMTATMESIEVDDISALHRDREFSGSDEEASVPENRPARLYSAQANKSHSLLDNSLFDVGKPVADLRPIDGEEVDELDKMVLSMKGAKDLNHSFESSEASLISAISANLSPPNSSKKRRHSPSSSSSPRLPPSRTDSPPRVRRSPNAVHLYSFSREENSATQEATNAASTAAIEVLGLSKSPQKKFRDSDALSDIPSDIDSATRERYLMACRILKSTLIEKDGSLLPIERTFLQGLLEDDDEAVSEAQVSAIETASRTLVSDPLFSLEAVHSSQFLQDSSPPGAEAAKSAWKKSQKIRATSSAWHTEQEPPLEPVFTSPVRLEDRDHPFLILGARPHQPPGVLTPALMESLRGFFPYGVAEENFWLKFSMERDGAHLPTLLSKVRTSKHTIFGVETKSGHVFGAFCSSHWRVRPSWFGSGESFLWRLKASRAVLDSTTRNYDNDNEMEVYPYTRSDEMIQYCTEKTVAVGGGEFSEDHTSPYAVEPKGIGFMIDGDLMGGETSACATFNNPSLGDRKSRSNEFEVVHLEVWTVTPCASVEEAERLELHRLFVEEQTNYR
jgi:hypothetical protein